MILRVDVTAEDIAAGVARDCAACPIGLAIARAGRAAGIPPLPKLKPREYVFIEHAWYRVGPYNGVLPGPAIAFIHHFDRGQVVVPFVFDLDLAEGKFGHAPSVAHGVA